METLLGYYFKYATYLLTPLHIVVCFTLIAIVLMQAGKGADFAGVFGGGGTQTAFGPRGVENTLSRSTKWAAIMFMVTSLGLSVAGSKNSGGDTLDDLDLPSKAEVEAEAKKNAPAEVPDTDAGATTAPQTAPAAQDDAAVPGADPPAETGTGDPPKPAGDTEN